MEKFYAVRKTRPGADCGSDHELLIANSDLNPLDGLKEFVATILISNYSISIEKVR